MELSLGKDTFYGCENFKKFSRPIKLLKIGEGCFAQNQSLEFEPWNPEFGLTFIPNDAFSNCNFVGIKLYNNEIIINDYAFASNSALSEIDLSEFDGTQLPPTN